ncbi:hypothetical protein [Sphingomonas oryzagri]
MTRRVAHILSTALRHGASSNDISEDEFATEVTRQIFTSMREPSEAMASEGDEALEDIAGHKSPAAKAWTAMMDAALAEQIDKEAPGGGESW